MSKEDVINGVCTRVWSEDAKEVNSSMSNNGKRWCALPDSDDRRRHSVRLGGWNSEWQCLLPMMEFEPSYPIAIRFNSIVDKVY